MSEPKTTVSPFTSLLDPNSVYLGWEGVAKVHGNDFEKAAASPCSTGLCPTLTTRAIYSSKRRSNGCD